MSHTRYQREQQLRHRMFGLCRKQLEPGNETPAPDALAQSEGKWQRLRRGVLLMVWLLLVYLGVLVPGLLAIRVSLGRVSILVTAIASGVSFPFVMNRFIHAAAAEIRAVPPSKPFKRHMTILSCLLLLCVFIAAYCGALTLVLFAGISDEHFAIAAFWKELVSP